MLATIAVGCSDGTGPGESGSLPTQPIVLARLGSTGWEIVRVNPDGTGATTLTTNAGDDIYPSWSPDHTRIAFLSSRPAGAGVFIMNADGSAPQFVYRPPFGLSYTSTRPAWAPDQRMLALGDNGGITRFRIDGTDPRQLGAGDAPTWSPDGRQIAFMWNGGIMVANADGTNRKQIAALGVDPAWSPDGHRIAFATGRFGASFVYSVKVDGTDRRRMTLEMPESPNTTDLSPAWSPDGNWITFQREYSVCSGRDRSCKGFYDVFVSRMDGSDLRKVTTDGASVRPSW